MSSPLSLCASIGAGTVCSEMNLAHGAQARERSGGSVATPLAESRSLVSIFSFRLTTLWIPPQGIQQDKGIRQHLFALRRSRDGSRSTNVRGLAYEDQERKPAKELTGVSCTHSPSYRTVPQGEGEFEYFEQVQLINLCPMEAEEAKALIPRSVPAFPLLPASSPRAQLTLIRTSSLASRWTTTGCKSTSIP